MPETASIQLSDGTVCVLVVQSEESDRPPKLMLMRDGKTVEVNGEQAVYDLLKLMTGMPWGSTSW